MDRYIKTLRLFPLVIEHSIVVVSARLNPVGSQFMTPVLWNLCSESVGGTKFWDPFEDSETGSPSSVTVKMEYVFHFPNWYCEFCVENQWGRGRKHRFVNFCSLAVFELSVDEKWWGRIESLI